APTFRWVHEAMKTIRRVSAQEHLTQITIPTLILAPVLDGIIPYAAQEELSRNFRAGQLVTINGARHELFQERDIYRAQALAAIGRKPPPEPPPHRLSAAVEEGHRLLVPEPAAVRHDVSAIFRSAAVPGGDHPAGLLEQRDQRAHVIGLQAVLDHEIDMA